MRYVKFFNLMLKKILIGLPKITRGCLATDCIFAISRSQKALRRASLKSNNWIKCKRFN